ncbi:MAG TPA: OmpA family protein [Alphaproteobacteria bacterium]|nr:OmpA family protein [Alphaproteobacteria bacterium]
MKSTAFTFAITLTAVSLCLSAPATAQLYLEGFRADKPSVEMDLDVLNDLQPRDPKTQQKDDRNAPVLRQPPPPAYAPAQDNPPAVPAPRVETAPRTLNKPLFAAPIPTPMPQAAPVAVPQAPTAPAAPKPAARKPYNPYLTAPPPAMPAARAPQPLPATTTARPATKQTLPVQNNLNDILQQPASLPHRKPEMPAAAPAQQDISAPLQAVPAQQKAVLSYPPPAAANKAAVQHYARPVMPAYNTLEMPPAAPRAQVQQYVKPAPKPPIETLPEEVISEAEMNGLQDHAQDVALLPVRKPDNATEDAEDDMLLTADEKAMPREAEIASETQVPLPAPKPFTRPALIVTDKKPPAAPRAVLKTAEVTMPISETEYEQLAENMETVPVQVALAPPKPVYAPKAVSTADLTLEFDRTTENLNTAAQSKLKNIIDHMKADTAAKLQVRAYATGDDGSKASARSKSLTRATEVRSFLMDNGIKPTRVIVRALGQETDRKPLDRIELTFVK